MPIGLKPAAQAAATSLWGMFSEFVVPCYYFTVGPVNRGTMECIIRPVPARYVDGSDVKAGDSQIFIPAAQMTAVPNPVAGDYLLTLGGAHRWDVLSGQLTASQVLVRLIVRRAY